MVFGIETVGGKNEASFLEAHKEGFMYNLFSSLFFASKENEQVYEQL